MKKFSFLFTMLAAIVLLAACGSDPDQSSVTNNTESVNQPDSVAQEALSQDGGSTEELNFEVPLQTALIVGSFELEGTEYEITPEQAAELLPLWIVLKNLLESETVAMEEVNALINQISEKMTDGQMAYINDLNLDAQSMRTLMEELGLNEASMRPESTDGEESQRGANRQEGMPEGMGPGGGQGGTGLTQEQMEAMQATREAGGGRLSGGMGMTMNTELIEALIELLQIK
jgi:hypothetical protein